MVSNDLISVLFAVSCQHISPASDVVVLIDVVARRAPSESAATLPLFKVFRCYRFSQSFVFPSGHCTVWSCLFTQDSTRTALRSAEGATWRPTAAHFIPSKTHSGPVRSGPVPSLSPTSPLALALHFYAQVSICKIRSFKHECPINASAASWYRVFFWGGFLSVRIHPSYTGKYYSLNLSRLLEKFLFEVWTGIKVVCLIYFFVQNAVDQLRLIYASKTFGIRLRVFSLCRSSWICCLFVLVFFVFHCRHVYMWHCKCSLGSYSWKMKWSEMGVQIRVMSVFTLFDCPLNFLLD